MAWDKTIPAAGPGSPPVSAPFRANWDALEAAIGNPDTTPLDVKQATLAAGCAFEGPPTFAPGTVTTPDATVSGRIDANVTDANNSGAGETDLHSYTIKGASGAVLSADKKMLRFVFVGTTTTANTKTLRFRYGTATLTFATFTTSAEPWIVEVYVWRDGASAQRIMGRQTVEANSQSVRWVAGTNSNSADQTAKISGQSSNSSEITCRASSVEVVG